MNFKDFIEKNGNVCIHLQEVISMIHIYNHHPLMHWKGAKYSYFKINTPNAQAVSCGISKLKQSVFQISNISMRSFGLVTSFDLILFTFLIAGHSRLTFK